MYQPKNSSVKKNPAGENNRAPTPLSSPHHTKSNMDSGKKGKVTNPREIPNTQGFVGKRISK